MASKQQKKWVNGSPNWHTSGTVEWYSSQKGYGLISCDNKWNDSAFVHFSDIKAQGFKSLKQGEAVEFDLVPTGEGKNKWSKMKAVKVTVCTPLSFPRPSMPSVVCRPHCECVKEGERGESECRKGREWREGQREWRQNWESVEIGKSDIV